MINLLIKHRHRLPHWTLKGAFYTITFKLKDGNLNPDEIKIVLEHIKSGHNKFYHLVAVQVMPDHVHLILNPNDGYSPKRIVTGIKGVTVRRINQHRGKRGSLWMVDYYGRIIRNQRDFDEKLRYMFENPVRSGLTEKPESYPGW